MKISDRYIFVIGVSTILVAIHLIGGCDGDRPRAQPEPIPHWINQPRNHTNQ